MVTRDAKGVFFWGRNVDADDPDVVAGLPMVHPNQWQDAKAPFLYDVISANYQAVMAFGVKTLNVWRLVLTLTQRFSPLPMTSLLALASLFVIRC